MNFNARFVTLVAGVLFFFLALVTQGVLPFLEPSSRTTDVTAVIRTDLGQLKWTRTEATDYTPVQQLGRRVYLREGCWYCHSQYVRPVTGETRRWGPVSEAGEYAYDVPHLFGTRRIGPDLTRVGLKYGDEWHLAHFFNPRMLTPESIMAPFRGLFAMPNAPIKIVDDAAGNRTLERTETTQKLFDFDSKEQIKLTPNADGLLFVPMQAHDKFPLIWTPNKEYTGDTVKIAAETDELRALIAYVQKLGMNRGKWRDLFEPQEIEVTDVTMPRSAEWVAYGKEVWQSAKCWECHGQTGKGDGEKAPGLKDDFNFPVRPADLTSGQFKSGPSAQDIFRTMSTGLSGTPMPSYRDSVVEQDRWALAYYVLSLSAFKDPLTGEPLQIPAADKAALDDPKLAPGSPEDPYLPGGGPKRSAAASETASAELARAAVQTGGNAAPHKSE